MFSPVTVIIPTLNEAENLPHVLPRIPSWVHEVILVDGRSTDRTIEVAQRVYPSIRVIEELARDLEKGPPLARVDSVTVSWRPPTGRFSSFGVRYAEFDA